MSQNKSSNCAASQEVSESTPTVCPPPPKASIGDEVNTFIKHIDSLEETLPLAMLSIGKASKKAHDNMQKFHEECCEPLEEGELKGYRVKHEHWRQFNRLVRQSERASLSFNIVSRSFFVSLVSQYDAYLGRLLRAIFIIKPEMLNASERNITFSQLMEFSNIESAKEFVLEKEIEGVLRKSHAEQFEWLEKKFDMKLRSGLDSWKDFIELTERRNLFVHADGVVSSQYLSVCCNHGVTHDVSVHVGSKLGVDRKYFKNSCECIFEFGVKLAHVLWRKLLPEQRQMADGNLISVCYELLVEERNILAKNLLDFSTVVIKKHANDHVKRTLVINRAQAYKWLGKNDEAIKIINEEDWTATGEMFQMAEAVIRDDYERATKIMREMGSRGKITKVDYKEWPLFKEWRKTELFKNAYEEVFGEPLELVDLESINLRTKLLEHADQQAHNKKMNADD